MNRPLSLVLVVAGLLLPAPASHAALQESGTADADLRTENERLRKAVSDLTLDKMILTEAAKGN